MTDVAMPGMSGLQLAARLKPQRPEMKTLFVSGYAHDELGRSGLAPAEVLSKPFRAPELAQRVRALLQQAPALIQ